MLSTIENSLEVKLSSHAGDACLSVKMGKHDRKTIFLGNHYDELAIAHAFIKMGHSLKESIVQESR